MNGKRISDRPNILVIWGDDIGWSNLSVYNHAVMGYATPNIDRIAMEGALFTDHYAQPSCTAGRGISGKTIWETGTNICPQFTDLMSFLGTFTITIPRKKQNSRITRTLEKHMPGHLRNIRINSGPGGGIY